MDSYGSEGNYTRYARYQNDVVRIRPGTTDRQVVFFNYDNNHHIELDGLILDATNARRGPIGLDAEKNNRGVHHIRIKNCEIDPTSPSQFNPGTISWFNVDDGELLNNHIHHAPLYGIYYSGRRGIIDGNIWENTGGYAIHMHSDDGNVNDNIVSNNLIRNSGFDADGCHGGCQQRAIVTSAGSNNQIYNNLLYNNWGGIQIVSGSVSNIQVYNNTVYNSPAFHPDFGITGCIFLVKANDITVRNNLCYQSTTFLVRDSGSGLTCTNNMADTANGGLCGTNYVQGDPLFVSAAGGDFKIQSGSPAINAGFTLGAPYNVDKDGITRPPGKYTIGAYQFGDCQCSGCPSAPCDPCCPPQPVGLALELTCNGHVQDSSGQGHHGTLQGNATATGPAIVSGQSCTFDGDGDFVSVTGTPVLRSANVALAFWFKSDTLPAAGTACNMYQMGASTYGFGWEADGRMFCYFNVGGSFPKARSAGSVIDNTHRFAACTFDQAQSQVKLWLETANVDTVSAAGSIAYTGSENLSIGGIAPGSGGGWCDALVDNVRIFDEPLTQEGMENTRNEDIPQLGITQTGMVWTKPNRPVGQTLGLINTDREHPITLPIGIRVAIENGSGEQVVEHFPLACCLTTTCDADADWLQVSNTPNALGLSIGMDSVVNMGDSTMSTLLPRGSMTAIMGRFVADTIDLEQRTTLPHGGHTEWEYRPLVFQSPAAVGQSFMCRALREDGSPLDSYAHVKTLTLIAPPRTMAVRGMGMRGVCMR